MIQKILNLFMPKTHKIAQKYSGLSDFMLNATPEEQKQVFTQAAQKANEDQMKVFREAQLKTGSN